MCVNFPILLTYNNRLLFPGNNVPKLEIGSHVHLLLNGDKRLQQVILHDIPGQLPKLGKVTSVTIGTDEAIGAENSEINFTIP